MDIGFSLKSNYKKNLRVKSVEKYLKVPPNLLPPSPAGEGE
jgi:hypothetical protein